MSYIYPNRQLIDSDGSVVNRYTYQPFGRSFTSEKEETIANPWRFTGQYYDSETGDYYLRARNYNPYLSRFTSRDPIDGRFEQPMSLHKYLYCENEPVNRIDPFGTDYIDINFTYTHWGLVPGVAVGITNYMTSGPWAAAAGAVGGAVVGGLGGTAGMMHDFETRKFHLYAGPSWTSRPFGGVDVTMSYSQDDVSTGWHFGIAGSGVHGYHQRGANLRTGCRFSETGLTASSSFGVGLSFFYVFPGIDFTVAGFEDPVNYFQQEVDLLTRAVWMGQMLQDTGTMIDRGEAGLRFYLNAVFTARMLGM